MRSIIEAHRADIGRLSSRARKINNNSIYNEGKWVNMTLLLTFLHDVLAVDTVWIVYHDYLCLF